MRLRKILFAGGMVLFVAMVLFVGCYVTTSPPPRQTGSSAHIKCWSGGVVFYDGDSEGKVMNAFNSDGYKFMDAKTHQLTQVSGNCLVTYP